MKLAEFLNSLTEEERNYIATLDYGDKRELHRKALDKVIENGGRIDPESQLWFPYEVIELGKSCPSAGHEREFVACVGIVLFNILEETDNMNDAEISMAGLIECFSELQREHQMLLEPLLEEVINLG